MVVSMSDREDTNAMIEDDLGSEDGQLRRKRGRPRKSDIMAREAAAAAREALKALNIEQEAKPVEKYCMAIEPKKLQQIIKHLKKILDMHPGAEIVLQQNVAKLESEYAETANETLNSPNVSPAKIGRPIGEKMDSGRGYSSFNALEDEISYACRYLSETLAAQDPLAKAAADFWDFFRSLSRKVLADFGKIVPNPNINKTESSNNDLANLEILAAADRPREREALITITPAGPLFSSLSRRTTLDTSPLETLGTALVTKIVPTRQDEKPRTLGEVTGRSWPELQSDFEEPCYDEYFAGVRKYVTQISEDALLADVPYIDCSNAMILDDNSQLWVQNHPGLNLPSDVTRIAELPDAKESIDEKLLQGYNPDGTKRTDPTGNTGSAFDSSRITDMLLKMQRFQIERMLQGIDVSPSTEERDCFEKLNEELRQFIVENDIQPQDLIDSVKPLDVKLPFKGRCFSGLMPVITAATTTMTTSTTTISTGITDGDTSLLSNGETMTSIIPMGAFTYSAAHSKSRDLVKEE